MEIQKEIDATKFKTLKEIGWNIDVVWDFYEVTTEFGDYRVRFYPGGSFRVSFPGKTALNCESVVHGMELAQKDYEEKCDSLLNKTE